MFRRSVLNPIPRFELINHRLFVVDSGFIEDFALYEGNELILVPLQSQERTQSKVILLLKNQLTSQVQLGGFYGEQLIILPSHNPVKSEHWEIVGRVLAVQRPLEEALMSSKAWHVAHKKNNQTKAQQSTCGALYLSELARTCQKGANAFIASLNPLSAQDEPYIDMVPSGTIWFLFPPLMHQPIDASLPNQNWAIRRRYRNFHAWKMQRPRKSVNVLAFPLEEQSKKISSQTVKGAKLASK